MSATVDMTAAGTTAATATPTSTRISSTAGSTAASNRRDASKSNVFSNIGRAAKAGSLSAEGSPAIAGARVSLPHPPVSTSTYTIAAKLCCKCYVFTPM
jgi:hypothetical protein